MKTKRMGPWIFLGWLVVLAALSLAAKAPQDSTRDQGQRAENGGQLLTVSQADQDKKYEVQRAVEKLYSYLGENLNPFHYREGVLSPERVDNRMAKFKTDRLYQLPIESTGYGIMDLTDIYYQMYTNGAFLGDDIKDIKNICPNMEYLTPDQLARFMQYGVMGYKIDILSMYFDSTGDKGVVDYRVTFYRRSGSDVSPSYTAYTRVTFDRVIVQRQPGQPWKIYHLNDPANTTFDRILYAMAHPNAAQRSSVGARVREYLGVPMKQKDEESISDDGLVKKVSLVGGFLDGGITAVFPQFELPSGMDADYGVGAEMTLGYHLTNHFGVTGYGGYAWGKFDQDFYDSLTWDQSYYGLGVRAMAPIGNNGYGFIEIGSGTYTMNIKYEDDEQGNDEADDSTTGTRLVLGTAIKNGKGYVSGQIIYHDLDYNGSRGDMIMISLKIGGR